MPAHFLLESFRGAHLATVRLLEAEIDESPVEGAKWVQVAAEGTYKGHQTGGFTFNQEVFEDVVRNFRAHPAYELDEKSGLGCADVIPFDFHHASEEPSSRVGVVGAPAQAWATELEIRGDEGALELWALTRYLEPARTYVQQGKYKYTSVAVWPDSKDPKTGANVGWYLSSIAFTNDPFIQGMAPLAAHRKADGSLRLGTDHLFGELKYILGVPETATAADVQLELSKLRAMALGTEAPPTGVDVEGLLSSMRCLLNLPVLSGAEEIFAELDKLMGTVAAASPSPVPSTEPAESPNEMALERAQERKMWKLIVKLARLADVEVPADADEVQQQVVAERVVEKILAEADQASGVREGLAAMMKALGVEDIEAGVERIVDLIQGGEALTKAMPALAALKEQTVEAQDEEEEEEVMAVMRDRGWGDELKDALMLQRSGGVSLSKEQPWDEFHAALEKKKAARVSFRTKYPVAERNLGHLGVALATSRADGGAINPILASGKRAEKPVLGDGPEDGRRGAPRVDLSRFEGENNVQRAMSHVEAEAKAAGRTLTYDEIHSRACLLVRELRSAGALQPQG